MISKTIKFNNIYKKGKCLRLCVFKFFAELNNCSFRGIWENKNSLDCNWYEMKEYTANFNFKKSCSEHCPLECLLKKDSFHIDESYFGEDTYDFIRLEIFSPKLIVTERVQFPKTTAADLVSKLGGTLGFFIGFR